MASALGDTVLRRCLEGLRAHGDEGPPLEVHVVPERGSREETLNAGIQRAGTAEDVLFVGDDIGFTPGWRAALERHGPAGEVLGMCTLDPGTQRIQDRGYDLVEMDGEVVLEARDRGIDRDEAPAFGARACDAVCGCFLWVRAPLLQALGGFPLEGSNRWGEFLFAQQARRRGARVAVVEHYLEHAGQSTKSNPSLALRSESRGLERSHWQALVRRYVAAEDVRRRVERRVDPDFVRALADPRRRVVLFGVGTVAERLLEAARPELGRWTLTSGLDEEAGTSVGGHVVQPLDAVDWSAHDWVIVTPLHRGERLWKTRLADRIGPAPPDGGPRVSCVELVRRGDRSRLVCRDLAAPEDAPAAEGW